MRPPPLDGQVDHAVQDPKGEPLKPQQAEEEKLEEERAAAAADKGEPKSKSATHE